MNLKKIPGISWLLTVWALVVVFMAFSAYTELQFFTWRVLSWGWEGDLFYIVYNQIRQGNLPYIDFFIEYPPLVPYIISLPWAIWGQFVELSKLEFRALYVFGIGCWLGLVFWGQYRLYKNLGTSPKKVLPVLWLMLINLVLTYTLVFTRFDIFPAMSILIGFSLYLSYQQDLKPRNFFAACLFIILGGFLKIYGFVLLPIIFLVEVAQKRYRNLAWLTLAFCLILVINLPFVIFGYERFEEFLSYQQSRSVQVESLYAGPLLLSDKIQNTNTPIEMQNGTFAIQSDLAFAVGKWALPIIICFLVIQFLCFGFYFWQNRKQLQTTKLQEILALQALLYILTFVIFNFIFSPQYLVWLILMIPLSLFVDWRDKPKLALILPILTVVASILTTLIWPLFYWALLDTNTWMIIILNLRNLSLLTIWICLVWLSVDRLRHLGKSRA